jgi:hypothetical protein
MENENENEIISVASFVVPGRSPSWRVLTLLPESSGLHTRRVRHKFSVTLQYNTTAVYAVLEPIKIVQSALQQVTYGNWRIVIT